MVESSFVPDEESDYIPKNILLTGGAGFIASHVAILLATKYPQYNVVVYDKLDYCSCLANLEEVSRLKNFKFIKGDICSPDLVSYVMTEEDIDTVMHFAAQTHVDNSFGNSFNFTQSNIYGTHVLLEAAKIHKGLRDSFMCRRMKCMEREKPLKRTQ
jgi:UDP-glucose 4,6-dehydratase